MSAWLLAFACGLGAGIVSAWGVGGGTLLLVLLTLVLHVEQRTAQGINLLFFLPTAAAALLSHARAGRLDRPTLRAAVPAAAAAALAGAWIATGNRRLHAAQALRHLSAALRHQPSAATKVKKAVTEHSVTAFLMILQRRSVPT